MGAPSIEESRARLLAPLAGATDVTLVTLPGNIGDQLIEAGTEKLLAGVPHLTIPPNVLHRVEGDVLVVVGSGGWCRFYHSAPRVARLGETRFRRVVVFPSSFDLRSATIGAAVKRTTAKLFAREWASYDAVDLVRPSVELAHDAAFFYPLKLALGVRGELFAYRTDLESAGAPIPEGNVDISLEAKSLTAWKTAIASVGTVYTDRAHVMIAAALMGKRVRYRPGAYFKVRSLADTWLADYDVEPGEP